MSHFDATEPIFASTSEGEVMEVVIVCETTDWDCVSEQYGKLVLTTIQTGSFEPPGSRAMEDYLLAVHEQKMALLALRRAEERAEEEKRAQEQEEAETRVSAELVKQAVEIIDENPGENCYELRKIVHYEDLHDSPPPATDLRKIVRYEDLYGCPPPPTNCHD
ncbi:hypothetical protein B0H13DRAFT_1879940 [Mycena leptocephala]|nr:hypothetical protein B0H13DRAFT_1879940 [Mycena leptocephala]